MDKAQREALLVGLPLSSRIACDVFDEAMADYSTKCERELEREQAFEERLKQEILKRHEPIDPTGWERRAEWIDAESCFREGTSPSELDVMARRDGAIVNAWVPSELCHYKPDFRELLLWSEQANSYDYDGEGVDPNKLLEKDWLVVFGAAAREQAACVSPAIARLLSALLTEQPRTTADIERLKVGREKVVAVLARECFLRSLRKGREKTQFDLNVFGSSERPAFLPTGWESPHWPAEDTLDSAREWLACTLEALEQWQASKPDEADAVSQRIARQARDDTWRLARHFRDNYGITVVPDRPTDESLSTVIMFVDELAQAFKTPKRGGQARGKSRAWHDRDEFPPAEYPVGELSGTKEQLARWILRAADHRTLDGAIEDGKFWGREDVRGKSCSIWFKTQKKFDEADKRRRIELGIDIASTGIEAH